MKGITILLVALAMLLTAVTPVSAAKPDRKQSLEYYNVTMTIDGAEGISSTCDASPLVMSRGTSPNGFLMANGSADTSIPYLDLQADQAVDSSRYWPEVAESSGFSGCHGGWLGYLTAPLDACIASPGYLIIYTGDDQPTGFTWAFDWCENGEKGKKSHKQVLRVFDWEFDESEIQTLVEGAGLIGTYILTPTVTFESWGDEGPDVRGTAHFSFELTITPKAP